MDDSENKRPEWTNADALMARVHILEARMAEHRRPLVEDIAYRSLAQSSETAWRQVSELRVRASKLEDLASDYQDALFECLNALEASAGVSLRTRELRAIAHRLDAARQALRHV